MPDFCPLHGLLESHEHLYEQQRVPVTHVIVEVRPYKTVNVEVANSVQVPKQRVGRAPIPSQILAMNLDSDAEVSDLPEEGVSENSSRRR